MPVSSPHNSFARSGVHVGSDSGFTLIEMLVSVSVTAIMLLIVGRIFNDTNQTIGRGNDVSQIIAESRTIHDQLLEDGNRMRVYKSRAIERRDEPGGFLVIVQELTPFSNSGNPNDPASANDPPGEGINDPDNEGVAFPSDPTLVKQSPQNFTNTQPIRTDQMFFFADANQLASVVPGNATRYDSDASALTARIWWGHATRSRTGDQAFPPEPGTTVSVSDLVLGRQALLLLDNQSSFPNGAEVGDSDNDESPDGAIIAFNQQNGSNGDLVLDSNNPTIVTNFAVANGGNTNVLSDSGTDIARIVDSQLGDAFSFSSVFEEEPRPEIQPPNGTPPTAGYYSVNSPSGFNLGEFNRTRPGQQAGAGSGVALNRFDLPTLAYANSALGWGYGLGNGVSGPRPIAQSDVEYPYSATEIAQTHTFFAPYVSDFIVEFAADIRDDFGDDPNTPGVFDPRPIGSSSPFGTMDIVRDGLPDGTPDTVSEDEENDTGGAVRAGSVKWYSLVDANDPIIGPFDQNEPITWQLPDLDNPQNAYHTPAVANDNPASSSGSLDAPGLADTNDPSGDGHLFSSAYPPLFFNDGQQAILIFAHTADVDYYGPDNNLLDQNEQVLRTVSSDGITDGDDWESGAAKWWPYMLRIRYRLHDGDGTFGSVDENNDRSISGKWFEQIIPIPRRP